MCVGPWKKRESIKVFLQNGNDSRECVGLTPPGMAYPLLKLEVTLGQLALPSTKLIFLNVPFAL